MAANVYFRVGTRAQFDALATKSSTSLYWLTDTQELYRGDVLFGVGREASRTAMGLLSAYDKRSLDDLMVSGVVGLKPSDASVVIAKDPADGMKTVCVSLSEAEANALMLNGDGLYVPDVEFTVERKADANDGYLATYRLKRCVGSNVTYVGDEINIPRDFLVKGAKIEDVVVADEPYVGAAVGDKYIDFTINVKSGADSGEHLYLPVNDLVDTYTAGDGIDLSNGVFSLPKKFYDYLNAATYMKPAVSAFTVTGLGGSAEIGTGVSVSSMAHCETNIENLVGNLTLSYNGTTLLSDIEPTLDSTTVNFPETSVMSATAGTKSFVLSGTDAKGSVISKSVGKTFYVPKFCGASEAPSLNAAAILELARGSSFPASVTLDSAGYIYFVTDGTIHSVKDNDSGFGVPLEDHVTTAVTVNGVTVNYKVYRSSSEILAGTYSFTVS